MYYNKFPIINIFHILYTMENKKPVSDLFWSS